MSKNVLIWYVVQFKIMKVSSKKKQFFLFFFVGQCVAHQNETFGRFCLISQKKLSEHNIDVDLVKTITEKNRENVVLPVWEYIASSVL